MLRSSPWSRHLALGRVLDDRHGAKVVRPQLGLRVEDGNGVLIEEIRTPARRSVRFDPEHREAIMAGLNGAATAERGTSSDVFADRIGSVGGRAMPRPQDLPSASRRVLDNPRITLSDSARWDIYRGQVEEGLLTALDTLAERERISVSVLSSGHPREVWATSRPSAHGRGYAADIYAVGGRLVIRQREGGSAAHALAASLVTGGAAQVGSPWVLPPGGARSFSDDVHQDHIHVQSSTIP
jgi:hypothetical protein